MFTLRPVQLTHGTLCQPHPIGRAGVERGHTATFPTEDGFELGNGSAVVRRPGRTDLADTVRALLDASCIAGIAE